MMAAAKSDRNRHRTLQPIDELEEWHERPDPWEYENTPDDMKRKQCLLASIPPRDYVSTLDMGCGQGFVTRDLPGKHVTGVDISREAIEKAKKHENENRKFLQGSIFDLTKILRGPFDLIVITGVLYPQYIGNSLYLVYGLVDDLLMDSGILACVHVDSWYRGRFPYLMLKEYFYAYRDFFHRLEIYVK